MVKEKGKPSCVRVRFAPSPTGSLHIGGARTALYSYLFSKSQKGAFILRVEDTDFARSTKEHLIRQLRDLEWLGLKWDEGPLLESGSCSGREEEVSIKEKGVFGPYFQSQRLSIYKEEAKKLLERGHAFYCFLTEDEWELEKKKAKEKGVFFKAKSPYRDLSLSSALKRIKKGEVASLRFKNNFKKDFILKDRVRGFVTLPSSMVGDFVLIRSNGVPVYNFCCVVDDVLMQMSHVFRAEEHLSNTLRQLMVYEALNYPLPSFGHFSLVLGSDRQKLSKRHGACSVYEYKERGYLPEALVNYMALLGWSSPESQEILNMEDLVSQFSLERLNPASAVFDEKRLNWMNAMHLRALGAEELWSRLKVFFKKEGLEFSQDELWQEKALDFFKSSMVHLKDGVKLLRPFSDSMKEIFFFDKESKAILTRKKTRLVLEAWVHFLTQLQEEFISMKSFKEFINTSQKTLSVKGKELFMPLRFLILGEFEGSELKGLISLISRKRLIEKTRALLRQIEKI